MSLEVELLSVKCDENSAEVLFGDMAYELHVVHGLNRLMVADGYCEKQLVVFTTIQGAGGDIHVHLFCHHCCLIVDGDVFLEYSATYVALRADMDELGAQTVADVHH